MELLWFPWILVRLLVPLVILRYPFRGSLAAILADMIDVVVWDSLGVANLSTHYNQIDKLLDNYMYLIQGYTAWFWLSKEARNIALGLLAYRTVGFILYEIFSQRVLLFIFPNVFIFFYLYYVGYKYFTGKELAVSYKSLAIIVSLLAIPKLFQEYLFHVAEFPLYTTIQNLFLSAITIF